jgi:hypothetical protein
VAVELAYVRHQKGSEQSMVQDCAASKAEDPLEECNSLAEEMHKLLSTSTASNSLAWTLDDLMVVRY